MSYRSLVMVYLQASASVLSLIALKVVCIAETVPADRLLASFREHNVQMMFVVDEYGGVEGILTLRDVVDELLEARPVAPTPAHARLG